MVDDKSNETTVAMNQAKSQTLIEDVTDWVGNMLTNKYVGSIKVTISM